MLTGMTVKRGRGRPATGETPRRTIRMPDERWSRLLQCSQASGTTAAQIINDLVEDYLSHRQPPGAAG